MYWHYAVTFIIKSILWQITFIGFRLYAKGILFSLTFSYSTYERYVWINWDIHCKFFVVRVTKKNLVSVHLPIFLCIILGHQKKSWYRYIYHEKIGVNTNKKLVSVLLPQTKLVVAPIFSWYMYGSKLFLLTGHQEKFFCC